MVRMHFTRNEGTLGKTGSLDFLFERKGVFKINAAGLDKDELELELIDFGADEVEQVDNEIYVYTPFQDFGRMQKALEEKKINVMSSELQRFPTSTVEVSPEQEEEILELIDKFEQEDDVAAVYHNMKGVS
jgi:transcriptional/translational regulatory protein YebC/TACO1